ncbi:hypothetical protein ACFO25_03090 [Paenactinomyces guangxiensis]|uniref:Uncharacterized protein n=1 Tax=Paenactinomyces guangxiensis TaxID=1490290 RepID=A0A7W1WT95_9BACL|nr:hypothetical protein [Paenactinomyces guangxiensis]MBA4495666.1 hypothetical protein [Paenactinomyces guangxiensis]MBH8592654.1 hypothetical protein [Paenactinomyces guangxiensis]
MEFLEKLTRDSEFRNTIFKDREEYIQFLEYTIYFYKKVMGKEPETIILSAKLFEYIDSIEKKFNAFYNNKEAHSHSEKPEQFIHLSQGTFRLVTDPDESFLRCE